MFSLSVQEVSTWMDKTLRRPDLSLAVSTYLLGRGLVTMEDCIPSSEGLVLDLVQTTDRLGWDCFLEGRISRAWTPVVSQIMVRNSSPTRGGSNLSQNSLTSYTSNGYTGAP